MKKTQEERVIYKLTHDGFITRNECLKVYITRLSGIINVLRSEGWDFKAEYIKTDKGKDYRYKVIKSPYKLVVYTTPDGRQIFKTEKI